MKLAIIVEFELFVDCELTERLPSPLMRYASNKYIDPLSIPAYEAVAEYLLNK